MAITPLDELDLIRRQHARAEELISAMEVRRIDRHEALRELGGLLAAHAAAEERGVFRRVTEPGAEPLLRRAAADHAAINNALADMLAFDPDDDEMQFDAALAVLAGLVAEHVRRSEAELFPLVRVLAVAA
jgi:hypothetical protein